MAADVRPYFIPDSETVRWDPWALATDGDWVPMPDAVNGWDPDTDLKIRRTVQIDPSRFTTETGLNIGQVVVTTSWISSTTAMSGAEAPLPVPESGLVVAEAVMRGERLGGVMSLRSTVALARAGAQRPGVAHMPGSVLAEHSRRVALEGSMSMFPVHDIDFAYTRLSADASWHLETSTDLTAPFLGTFQLLLNNRDAELMSAVARGSKDKRQQALRDELQQGVAAVLLELAVALRTELEDGSDWPADSVGEVLLRTLATAGREFRALTGAHDIAEYRTRIAGAIRNAGHGRAFR